MVTDPEQKWLPTRTRHGYRPERNSLPASIDVYRPTRSKIYRPAPSVRVRNVLKYTNSAYIESKETMHVDSHFLHFNKTRGTTYIRLACSTYALFACSDDGPVVLHPLHSDGMSTDQNIYPPTRGERNGYRPDQNGMVTDQSVR